MKQKLFTFGVYGPPDATIGGLRWPRFDSNANYAPETAIEIDLLTRGVGTVIVAPSRGGQTNFYDQYGSPVVLDMSITYTTTGSLAGVDAAPPSENSFTLGPEILIDWNGVKQCNINSAGSNCQLSAYYPGHTGLAEPIPQQYVYFQYGYIEPLFWHNINGFRVNNPGALKKVSPSGTTLEVETNLGWTKIYDGWGRRLLSANYMSEIYTHTYGVGQAVARTTLTS